MDWLTQLGLVFLTIVLLTFIVILIIALRKKVYCPDCHTKMPLVRIPKSNNEVLWGGWKCSKCGCEMDRNGKKRASSKKR